MGDRVRSTRLTTRDGSVSAMPIEERQDEVRAAWKDVASVSLDCRSRSGPADPRIRNVAGSPDRSASTPQHREDFGQALDLVQHD